MKKFVSFVMALGMAFMLCGLPIDVSAENSSGTVASGDSVTWTLYDNGTFKITTHTAHNGDTATYTAQAVCGICGQPYGSLGEHSYSEDWSHDENEHWHECTVCGDKTDTDTHTWDEGEITTDPTASNEGVKTYTCTLCSAVKTESIPKTDITDDTTTAPTTSAPVFTGYRPSVPNAPASVITVTETTAAIKEEEIAEDEKYDDVSADAGYFAESEVISEEKAVPAASVVIVSLIAAAYALDRKSSGKNW